MSNKRLVLGLTFLFTLASCSSSSEDTDNTSVGEWTDFVEDSGNGDNTQSTKAKYQVFFYNGSTELFHTSVIEGRKVSYGGSQPKKDSTPTIKYIFVGWSEDPDADYTQALSVDKLPGIVKDSKFYAIFKEEPNDTTKYTAVFYSNIGDVYATVTKSKGQKIVQSDLGRSDDPVPSYEEGTIKKFQNFWNKIVDGEVEDKNYRFDSNGVLDMSDEETQADIDFLAAYYSSPVSYQCDFCSYDGISLFSFNLDHGKTPSESKEYIKDSLANVNKKYYEPPYCEDGKKYNFVGWSTTKGDTASNAKEFVNLPIVYGEQSYYAIVDFTTSSPVFVEILGTEPNGRYQILSYDDALSSNYFKVDGNELLSFYENSVMKTNPYSSNQVPYKLFISDSRIKTLGTNSLSSITSGSIRALSISSVETIKENAFQLFNYDSDTAIIVEGKNVTSIASKAFYSAGKIQYVSLPKISVIPESCFEAAKIVEAHLNSDSLTKISKKAFYGCSELKKIYIGKNVNTIEYYTDTSGAVLSPFSDTVYNSCKVDELTVNSANTTFKSSQNALIRKSDQALIFATNSTLTIPSDVKIIAAYSFTGLNNMSDKTITIPSSVNRIEASAFYRSAVKKIVFNGTKSSFKSICSRDFYNCTSALQQELRFDFTDSTNQTLSNVFN